MTSLNLISNSPVSNLAVPDVLETTRVSLIVPSSRLFSSIIANLPCRLVILSPCSKIVLDVTGFTVERVELNPVAVSYTHLTLPTKRIV